MRRYLGAGLTVLLAAVMLAVPYWSPRYVVSLFTVTVITALLAVSVNMLAGEAGLVSMGHAGISAAAGYAVAWAVREQMELGGQLALALGVTLLVSAVYNGGLSRSLAEARIEDAFRSVDFGRTRRSIPSRELSVYEKKQLMIASALVSGPALLMLDEPASGLTKPEIRHLDDLLVSVNKGGVTVLLIEHVLSLLLSVSQRLIVLNQGRVLAQGDPRDVVKNPDVVEAYLGGRG